MNGKPWVISIPPFKCPDNLTGIPDYYIHQFPGGDARYFNAGRNRPLLSF